MAKLRTLLFTAASLLAVPAAVFAGPSGNHCHRDLEIDGNRGATTCAQPSIPATGTTPDSLKTVNQQPTVVTPGPAKTISGKRVLKTVVGPDVTGNALPPITLTPIQPPTITGTAPIPPLATVISPPLTGQRPTVILTPLPPEVVTGMSPVIQGVQGPGYTGTSPVPVTLTPGPQTTITGLSPVIQGVQGPDITGSQTPTILTPNPPTTITGLSPAIQGVQGPDITGSQTPTILTPNPPTTFTGVSGPVSVPGQGFTGSQPLIVVYANPPKTFEGYGRVPATVVIVPPMVPQAVPQMVPQAVPQMVPQTTPALPQQTVVPTSGAKPAQQTVVVIKPPKPLPHPVVSTSNGGKIVHQPTVSRPAVGPSLITHTTGRQTPDNVPRFETENGDDWHCLASGHGARRTVVDGEVQQDGALRNITSIDVLGRDLPALHPAHADCIIAVRRERRKG